MKVARHINFIAAVLYGLALLHKSVRGRTDPNPRRSYATGTVTGQPS